MQLAKPDPLFFMPFLYEPGLLAALPRVAREGGKLPERLNGRLAVRVAMGYDALAGLHQQIGQVLTGLRQQQAAGGKKGG